MVCGEVSDVAGVVEILVLLLLLPIVLDVPIAVEHAVALVVAIGVVHLLAISVWLHLAAEEVRVDLLVWINTVVLIIHHFLPLHVFHLLLVHSHGRLLLVHLCNWLLLWLLLNLVGVVIVFFRVHKF